MKCHGEIDFVEGQIDKLFQRDWPMVIGNLGAGPSNCFFDRGTYRLQGCTNWSQVQVCPFGIAEAAIDRFLCFQNRTDPWTLRKNYVVLKHYFFSQWATAVKAGNIKWDERIHVALALGRLLYVNDALNKMSENKRRMKEEEETLWAYLDLFARDKWMAGEQKTRGLWDDALEYRD